MKQHISVHFPETLAFSLKMDHEEFAKEAKTLTLVKLYEMGKISSGLAARSLSLSRLDFLNMLHKYGVSYFANKLDEDLESDLNNA